MFCPERGRTLKKIIAIFLAVFVVGCATQEEVITLDDLKFAVTGEKPAGYPKTYIKSLPDRPGFCIKVTENWKPQDYQGQTVWLREKKIESLNCPWYDMQWQDRSAIRRDS